MKRTLLLVIMSLVLLAACGNDNSNKNDQSVNKQQDTQSNSNNVKTIATGKDVQGDDYRTILPFKESQARGVLQDNMANSYNGGDFEHGLLNLSKEAFPTDKYLYQDGQYLNKDTINAYLSPRYSKKEIDKMSESEKKSKKANENLGLNPSHNGETKPEKIADNSPAYLSNILEQDFYDSNDTKGSNIKGMTIGLAMNSVYYYQEEKDGPTYSKELDDKEIEKQGKAMASEMLTRLRANDDLKNIPIQFAIYKQSGQDSITPGEFIANTVVDEDQTKISKWNKINEVSTLLPSATAEKYNENLNNNFKQFNNNLQSYFSNFTQAVGKIKFVDKKPQQLTIDLPIDYYGQAETIGITQYVTEQAEKYFDNIDSYEIRIKDGNNARALITKTKDDKEAQVHIYSN